MLQKSTNQIEALAKVLPKDEAEVYAYLLNQAPKKASDVAQDLGLLRPIAYKLLDRLIEKELVIKHKKTRGVAVYNPQHPANLKAYIDSKAREVESNKAVFDASLPSLVAEFHTRFGGIPGFRVIMGIDGIREVYEDVLNEGKDIKLIRSPHDRENTELASTIKNQIQEQVQLGIHTKAITPLHEGIPKELLDADTKNLVERCIVPESEFLIPAQILIYGNKVAITAFGPSMMTTIVENAAIHDTFEILFNYIWHKAKNEHQKMLGTIQQ
ncbi:MAG: helix-turn-helix domain-containing protein [bacterium]